MRNCLILPIIMSVVRIYLQNIKNFINANFSSFLFGLKFGQTHQQYENIKPFFNNLNTSYIEAYNINS